MTATSACRSPLISSFQPHMHNRGKAQCMEAIYPDVRADSARPSGACGDAQLRDAYQFGWHITYPYADDVAPLLPTRTIIHICLAATRRRIAWPEPKNWSAGRAVDRRDEPPGSR
jgi:hypothetical protein